MREPIMQGRGYYNRHSELQARSAEGADGMLERALAAVAIPAVPPTIADFGSSQGHNSMRQIALMLDRLTERIGRERDVRVVHTDLPHCDYTSLFVTLETSPRVIVAADLMRSLLRSAIPSTTGSSLRRASRWGGPHSRCIG